MVTRYSVCHFAEVMDFYFIEKTMPPNKEWTPKCSWCGEFCEPVPTEHVLEHDLELTLRRWKDGDCTLDDMFDRVNKELYRSWHEAFNAAATTLQSKGTPKYTRPGYALTWVEADAQVSDLAVTDPSLEYQRLKSAQYESKKGNI